MKLNTFLASTLVLLLPAASLLSAGDKGARSSARSSVNRDSNSNRNTNVNRNNNTNVNRNTNTNVNRNTNVNVNKNVNVDVDVNHRGGYYGGGCCYHSGVGVAAAAVATAIVVGSIVNTLPPSCTVVMVNGITYQQCGNTWYQPQFSGGNTTYVVINAPR